ncbi:hypothetical protein COB11_03890 [Candidatus Aerophobetes bacterium]|uniref:Uncharacterized protein n=1 Tax=Aerophobetes bacterium TaxID=2030807 RepID=A0A2A4YHT2_UNCAE|nr:MAG: hypothetical protein COB11_03890 [Candidatus Aerophobetes bacterium]
MEGEKPPIRALKQGFNVMGYQQEDFEAPEHPSGETKPSDHMGNQKSHIGKALFDSAFNFYAWYLAHDNAPVIHCKVFEFLSEIMQISKISFENGLYLSAEEERIASSAILELSDSLATGFTKCSDIPIILEKILKKLTDDNPRALIIAALTKLEYKLCIHNELGLTEEVSNQMKDLIRSAGLKIVPDLPDLIVNTLARDLIRIDSKTTEDCNLIETFKDSVKILEY